MLGDKRGSKNVRKIRPWVFRVSYVPKKVLIPVIVECCVLASEIPSLFFPTSSPRTKIIIEKLNFTILVSCLWKAFAAPNSKISSQPNTIPAKQLKGRRKLMRFVSSSLTYLFTQFKVLFFHSTVFGS